MRHLSRLRLTNASPRGRALLLACFSLAATAQDSLSTRYVHSHWSADQGLVGSTVLRVRQARDGYLWVGTSEGISRFDGIRFANFLPPTTPGLSALQIRWLLPTRDGALWAASDTGVSRVQDGRWQSFGPKEGVVGTRVNALAEGRQGVWAGTPRGLLRYENGRFVAEAWSAELPSSYINQLLEDRQGALWLATKRGLVRRAGGESRVFTTTDGLPDDDISALFEDSNGTLWAGTHHAGLAAFRNGRFEAYRLADFIETHDGAAPHAIAEDRDGSLWIALHAAGILRLHGGRFEVWRPQTDLPLDEIYDLSFDREGNLWAALASGGGLLQIRRGRFQSQGFAPGQSSNPATSVAQTADGSIWIGTRNQGIMRLGLGGFEQQRLAPELRSGRVSSLLGTRDGGLCAGFDRSSVLCASASGSVRRFESPLPLRSAAVALAEEASGTLWVGYASGGIARLENGRLMPFDVPGFPLPSCRRILPARDGNLYLGTTNYGLLRVRGDQVAALPELNGKNVSSLHEDRDGDIWASTAGHGLFLIQQGRVLHWGRPAGLPSDLVYRVLESEPGELWLLSYAGLVHLRKSELLAQAAGRLGRVSFDLLDRADGLPPREGLWAPVIRDSLGRLWFPMPRGASVLDPRQLSRNLDPPPVRIEDVSFDDTIQPAVSGAVFGPGRGTLTFRFTALSLVSPDKNRFRYKLEGVDPDWIDAGSRRVTRYTNVAPGDHVFLVKACNNDRVWNDKPAAYSFRIRPRFYQTAWFYAAMAVLLLLSVWAILKWRTRQLDLRRRQLEEEVHSRTSELVQARDLAVRASVAKGEFLANMSHEIRTPMNAVIGMASLLERMELPVDALDCVGTIRNASESLMVVINDILDFSKIESGHLRIESRRFDLYRAIESSVELIRPKAAEKGLELLITIAPSVPRFLRGDETRLRQILLNLAGNAVKFTARGSVIVSASAEDSKEILFSVRDTGIGIPPERIETLFHSFSQVDASITRQYGGTGLGLAIARRLTELMGGRIWVESRPGCGSLFQFTLPASDAALQPAPFRERSDELRCGLLVAPAGTSRELLEKSLQELHLRIDLAGSIAEARTCLAASRYDLVLVDEEIDNGSGARFARELWELATLTAVALIGEPSPALPVDLPLLMRPLKPSHLQAWLQSVLAPETGAPAPELPASPELAESLPLRILVADDNAINRKVITGMLRRLGYSVDEAVNGLEVVEAVRRGHLDLVFLDLQMPEMDGLTAARLIAREFPAVRPRLVALTANTFERDRQACFAAGMDDFVPKPIGLAELHQALLRCSREEEPAELG